MITGSTLIHWILVVIFIGSCIFLFLGIVGVTLLMQWICYTAWRDPSTTMSDKIGCSFHPILFRLLEVAFIRVWLPMSDYTYWAIVLMAFVLHTLVLLWLDANTESIKSVVAEAMAQRRRDVR